MSGPPSASRRENLLADLALVLVTAIWGSTFIVNRLVLEAAPPLLFLVVRFGLGGVVLVALALRRPWTPRLMRDSAFVGLLLAIGIGLQIVAQLFTTASKAAFVTGLSVPLTPVVAWLWVKRKPTLENLAGLVLATVGFGVLTWPRGDAGVNMGDVLILGTAVAYAFVIVTIAERAPEHDVRWFAGLQTVFAALGVGVARLLVTPFLGRAGTVFEAEARPLPRTAGFLAAVLWMALAATVLTFVVQAWSQARMSATHAAILFSLEPVWASAFAALFLGERMSRKDWLGAGLVLLGILVSELPRGRK